MPYDPYNPNAHQSNESPFGGQISRGARDQAKAWAPGSGERAFYEGVADVAEGAQGIFYGNQNTPGLIGGTYRVNPNAWWGISGDPYRGVAGGAANRGQMFGGAANNQSRSMQMGLIQMLQNQAMGKGPSIAQNMLQQGTERNIAAGASMAASGRGPGAAMGAYNANNMAAQANQQSAMDSAILRAQEQMQAQGLLGSLLGQTRQQDLGFGQMELQDQKMRDDLVMQYMKMGYDADQANREAALKMEELKMKAYSGGEGGGGFLGGLFAGLS